MACISRRQAALLHDFKEFSKVLLDKFKISRLNLIQRNLVFYFSSVVNCLHREGKASN